MQGFEGSISFLATTHMEVWVEGTKEAKIMVRDHEGIHHGSATL
jgi:hypothetical protein